MTLPVSKFINPPPNSQEYNALAKALREKPRVEFIGQIAGVRYYQVKSTSKLGYTYPVRIWEDNDKEFIPSYGVVEKGGQLFLEEEATPYVSENGQFWIECFCPGASPPLEVTPPGVIAFISPLGDLLAGIYEAKGPEGPVIRWVPKSCYHMAAVLIEESNDNGTDLP